MKRYLFFPWICLLGLTTVGYVTRTSAEGAGPGSLGIPLVAAAIKFALVAWVFMELRSVARIWAIGAGFLLAVVLGMSALM